MAKLDDLLKQRAEIERLIEQAAQSRVEELKRAILESILELKELGHLPNPLEKASTNAAGNFNPYALVGLTRDMKPKRNPGRGKAASGE